jgi:hypothetical protein
MRMRMAITRGGYVGVVGRELIKVGEGEEEIEGGGGGE